jgi:hypothetical protein
VLLVRTLNLITLLLKRLEHCRAIFLSHLATLLTNSLTTCCEGKKLPRTGVCYPIAACTVKLSATGSTHPMSQL